MDKNTDNFALAGLILGISSLVGEWIPYVSILAIPAGIVGIVLSVKGLKSNTKRGMAMAGLVCSIVSLAIFVLVLICACVAVGTAGTYWSRYW
ncbi:MAG: hypothetical protein ILA19_03910 [Bacilli bacterium]|nr:hypothetical protein [Bacilli bacterium]